MLQSPSGRAKGAIPRRADRHAMLALSTAARSARDHFDRLNGSLEWPMCLIWLSSAASRFGTTVTRLRFFRLAGTFPTITACNIGVVRGYRHKVRTACSTVAQGQAARPEAVLPERPYSLILLTSALRRKLDIPVLTTRPRKSYQLKMGRISGTGRARIAEATPEPCLTARPIKSSPLPRCSLLCRQRSVVSG